MRRHFRVLGLVLATAIAAAGIQQAIVPALASIWQWSVTPANNATADPTINWSEGMSPSSVNDSARAMMAVVAKWRNDNSGAITTGGTSSAYTVTTSSVIPGLVAGVQISFRPHATNAASATLAVDGFAATAIHQRSGVAIAAGVLVAGTPYTALYNGTAWIIGDYYGAPFEVPVGAILDYAAFGVPNSNFAAPVGQCISRTTYVVLFNLIGTQYGACDGAINFALPDLRGRVVANVDGGTNRLVPGGCVDGLGNVCGSATHTITTAQLPVHTPTGSISGGTNAISFTAAQGSVGAGGILFPTNGGGGFAFNQNVDGTTFVFTGNPIGSGSAMPQVQSTIQLAKIMRIL